jgi:hypothetical protein
LFEPDSRLSTIGTSAFLGCSSLSSVCLPSSVRRMGNYVFAHCTSLSQVTFQPHSRLSDVGVRVFANCPTLPVKSIPSCFRGWRASVGSTTCNAF